VTSVIRSVSGNAVRHTIAKNLVKPCAKDAFSFVLDDKHTKAINKVPLPNSTFQEESRTLAVS
jgi:hypothetical protein